MPRSTRFCLAVTCIVILTPSCSKPEAPSSTTPDAVSAKPERSQSKSVHEKEVNAAAASQTSHEPNPIVREPANQKTGADAETDSQTRNAIASARRKLAQAKRAASLGKAGDALITASSAWGEVRDLTDAEAVQFRSEIEALLKGYADKANKNGEENEIDRKTVTIK